MGVDLCLLWSAGHGHCEGSYAGYRWKGFNFNHCFLLLSTGQIAEGNRHMQDSSNIEFVPVLHYGMVP